MYWGEEIGGDHLNTESEVAQQLAARLRETLAPSFVAVFLRRPRGWVSAAASDNAPTDPRCAVAAAPILEGKAVLHLPDPNAPRDLTLALSQQGVETLVSLRGLGGLRGIAVLGALRRILSARDRSCLERLAAQAVSALSWADAAEQLAAAKALARRGFLSASLTHDLGKPLTSIWAAARSLRRLRGDDPLVDRRLREIQEVADQGLGILDRLFERVQEDPAGTVPVGELVAMVCEAGEKRSGHSIQIQSGGDLHAVFVPSEVGEALGELLSNACRESPADAPIEVVVRLSGASLAIDVVDHGDGMTEAVAARAFQPWFTRRRDHGGRGLGLALCRLLLRQVGGEVEIVDRGGPAGTRMRISLEISTCPAR